MTDEDDGGRRVLAVRCSAWHPPSLVSRQSAHQTGPTARAFEQVVNAVQQFCPRIEVLRPGICAFAVRGPARYFGGEAELGKRVAEAVTGLGFDCGAGIADGMFAALLASRDALLATTNAQPAAAKPAAAKPATNAQPAAAQTAAAQPAAAQPADAPAVGDGAAPVRVVPPGGTPAFLAPRAVTVLGEPDLADLLVRLGIRTLGEFAALPAAEAGNRFGAHGLLAHRLARGLDPRPLAARPPSADLAVQVEFDPSAERSERVVFAAKSLAGRLHAQLAASGLACVRLQVQVVGDNGEESVRLWRHDGLLSELAVAERVRWQLDGWRAGRPGEPDGPGDEGVQAGGISLLRLVPDQLVQDQGRQLGLWGDAVVSDRVARAALRVQAMLGHDAVRQPVLAGGRSPSDQAVLLPFNDTIPSRNGVDPGDGLPAAGRPADRPWPASIPPPAPATVYQVPRQARVTDGSGSLVEVTGRGQLTGAPGSLSVAGGPPVAVTAWTGPWPVTERWWDPEHACRKARFQLVTADGAAWLAVVQDGRWLIEASYD